MSTRPKTVEQKIGEWQRAYVAVLDEMLASLPKPVAVADSIETRDPYLDRRIGRPALAAMAGEYTVIEGPIIADRRTAAIVAAMLVGQNVAGPRLPIETLESGE